MKQQNIEYLSLLGYQSLRHGRFDAAVTVFEGALVLEPDDGNLKRSLAYAYLNLGRSQDCLEILDGIGEPEDRTVQLIRSFVGPVRPDAMPRLTNDVRENRTLYLASDCI